MTRQSVCITVVLFLVTPALAAEPIVVRSPNDLIAIKFRIASERPVYDVSYRSKPVVADSSLGLTFREGGALTGLSVVETRRDSRDDTFPVIAGKSATARDHFNEATIVLQEQAGAKRR